MKRTIIFLISTILILYGTKTHAFIDRPELIMARSTVYVLEGTTHCGYQTRKGICAVGNKDYLGKTIIIYQRLPGNKLGKQLGIFEALDTGCSEYVIDVWTPNLEAAQEWMSKVYEDGCEGKIFIQVIDANG